VWDRLHDVLDGDIDHRTRQFRAGGLAAVLTGLHPGVRVDGRRILLPTVHSGRVELDARGLRLVPSAFAARLGVMTPEPALVYPARGAATLWENLPNRPGDPLADVIGRTKARLMRSIATPANTATLARRLGLAASTVNEHLTALVAAGLARRGRIGRRVLYRRSSLGDELVSSAS
jgi:DNA-binding transcriptional ArsR family regulator